VARKIPQRKMSPCPEKRTLLKEEDIRECSLISLKMPTVEKTLFRT